MDNAVKNRNNFLEELKKASVGQSFSLPYLRTSLAASKSSYNETFQVMVIGGTNFSESLVKKENNKIHILDHSMTKKIPLFGTGEDIMLLVLKNLRPNLNKVAINFAYPMESIIRDGKVDGILNEETKGHKFKDLLKKPVGESVEHYVFKNTGKKIDVVIANDTICLVLAGLSLVPREKIVGAIIGTGYNLGFFVDNETIVNLEAGRFDDFIATESGENIIKEVPNSNLRRYEIEIAGNYLFRHFNFFLEKEKIPFKKIDSTIELFKLAFDEKNNNDVKKLALEIVESSSRFVAVQLSGIAEFKNNVIDVILEGGLVVDDFVNLIENNVKLLTNHNVKFARIPESSIIGGAYLL